MTKQILRHLLVILVVRQGRQPTAEKSQAKKHHRENAHRNDRLEAEIAELEKAIQEIDGLERQKERLLARMEIIEQLQKSRPEIVHLFDEMVRQLPEGVYLTGLKQTGML